jgi:glycosyltransferase involved in cell wall biosynthesis
VAVDVILPCLNEAPALPWILERMPAGFRPVVVDNCSTDGSGEQARSLGATVVPEPVRGFGVGWRVSEVEVTYLPRIGKSKVTGTVRGCMQTVQDMGEVLAR